MVRRHVDHKMQMTGAMAGSARSAAEPLLRVSGLAM
jgi:hypothetical protein